MRNKDLFQRDLTSARLMNNGQARIDVGTSEQEYDTLRDELSHFVCEGQYSEGMQRILDSFLSHLSATSQPAAWVSGFYGSGKSHLLKMLGHLWRNTEFPQQGVTARTLVPSLPPDIEAALKELDTRGRQVGGVHAASGTLPSGGTSSVRLTILGILLRSKDLPESYAQARFCLYLRNNGFYDRVRSHVQSKGKSFTRELNDLYVSPVLREALIAVDPALGDANAVRETLKREFSQPSDISTSDLIRITREVLVGQRGQLPLTILVLDEVQQYIADSSERATQVVEVAEALSKQMESRLLLVGAGQNALGAQTSQFGKLRDRFTIAVELSDQDVETVTRKVLLAKKADKVEPLRKSLEALAGEIERQLASTAIASRSSDRELWVDDYPILPVRRRFWEHALRAVDPSGTSAMLRAQLRIIHDGLRDLADESVGHVVPADFIFDQLQPGMVQQGVLLRELDERIRKLDDGTDDGRLARRLCGLVFLVRKLPREGRADIGVRATADMLADLLVGDLAADGPRMRREVPRILKKLVDDGVLLEDHGEFNLQTRESSEWEKDYRNRITRIQASEHEVAQQRDALLRDGLQQAIRGVKVNQGQSKTPRQIAIHISDDPPAAGGTDVPVWIRDGWSVSEKAVLESSRAAGQDSATVFVFVPKKSADELRTAIIQAKAAKEILDLKGVPATDAGREARSAMQTRCEHAEARRSSLVRELIDSARVFKGGGQELHNLTLEERVRDAVEAALDRLFPQFRQADHRNWPVVIGRARNGDDSPLESLGWTGPTTDHPVCREILQVIGSGKDGRGVRKALSESPYGWAQDAIDGGLIALHAGGHLLATQAGTNVGSGQLDQAKIAKTEFRTESVTLTAQDKLNLRGLFQDAGLTVRTSDDLVAKSSEFLETVGRLALTAGGPAPLPEAPNTKPYEDLRSLPGNERLARMLTSRDVLKSAVKDARERSELAARRLPTWERLTRLLRHGDSVAALADVRSASDAIRDQRLLLGSTDRAAPLAKQAANALRAALLEAHRGFGDSHAQHIEALEANAVWQKISDSDKRRILAEEGIDKVPSVQTASDDDLIADLDRANLQTWKDRTDALHGRFANAATKAARLLEPKVQRVHLSSGTLKTEADVRTWLGEQETSLLTQLQRGPIVIA